MSTKIKCLIYITIASITALTTDISGYQTFEEITPMKIAQMLLNISLQALIALRAFLDQSISKDITILNENKKND